jgi:hypothetical protein
MNPAAPVTRVRRESLLNFLFLGINEGIPVDLSRGKLTSGPVAPVEPIQLGRSWLGSLSIPVPDRLFIVVS